MKRVIHKYPLNGPSVQIHMPVGAEILHIEEQHGKPCIWALHDQDEPLGKLRYFDTYGTGHVIPTNKSSYVGTFLSEGGQFVWHVFETFQS